MGRPRHPDKHIEAAVAYAESKGWRVEMASGHAWGRMYCPHADRGGCRPSVWSTPSGPENHAKRLIRLVDKCPHKGGEHDDV